jgi:hypothetical protein
MSEARKYIVTAVTGSRPWTPAGESEVKRIYYDLKVEGLGEASIGLLPTDPKPESGRELFAILKDGENGKPPTLVPVGQKKPGGGGFRGKSPEELAHDKANSAFIRAYEYYLIPEDKRPPLREYMETAGKIHTASTRLASGNVALEA